VAIRDLGQQHVPKTRGIEAARRTPSGECHTPFVWLMS
jgi:hypothetical protein